MCHHDHQMLFLVSLFFFFPLVVGGGGVQDRVSLCSFGCPRTSFVDSAYLKPCAVTSTAVAIEITVKLIPGLRDFGRLG